MIQDSPTLGLTGAISLQARLEALAAGVEPMLKGMAPCCMHPLLTAIMVVLQCWADTTCFSGDFTYGTAGLQQHTCLVVGAPVILAL